MSNLLSIFTSKTYGIVDEGHPTVSPKQNVMIFPKQCLFIDTKLFQNPKKINHIPHIVAYNCRRIILLPLFCLNSIAEKKIEHDPIYLIKNDLLMSHFN